MLPGLGAVVEDHCVVHAETPVDAIERFLCGLNPRHPTACCVAPSVCHRPSHSYVTAAACCCCCCCCSPCCLFDDAQPGTARITGPLLSLHHLTRFVGNLIPVYQADHWVDSKAALLSFICWFVRDVPPALCPLLAPARCCAATTMPAYMPMTCMHLKQLQQTLRSIFCSSDAMSAHLELKSQRSVASVMCSPWWLSGVVPTTVHAAH